MTKPFASDDPSSLMPRPRASQRVRDFIMAEAKKHKASESWRLPSIRQLAAHLNISMATVQNVYSALGQEGYVTSAAKRGSFFKWPVSGFSLETLYIGLAFNWEDDTRHAWESGIYAGILDASLMCRREVNFSRFAPTPEGLEAIREAHDMGKLHGMIILPGQILEPMMQLCETLDIPIAYLLPSTVTSVTNFVCPDVAQIAKQVANALMDEGRKRLAFAEYMLNDNRAYYGLYRSGFIQAILDRRKSLDSFVHIALEAANPSVSNIKAFLEGSRIPDAILCGGDNMAMDIIRTAEGMGFEIPRELSVIGGSGISLHDPRMVRMTRVQQPVKEIGRELFLLVESLATQITKIRPGCYIPCSLTCGDTTTSQENKRLLAGARVK